MIADLKPYVEYKETGLPWLSQVPSHWDVSPLARLARLKSIINQSDRQLLSVYLQRGVVRFSDVDEKRTNTTSEDLSKYQAVDPGDFVLNNQQAWRGSVGVSDFSGIVSPAYLVLALSNQYLPRYANSLFRDQSMVDQYLICSKGVGTIQRNLYWPHLKRVGVVVPPLDEQATIVRFLDWANGRLERAIRAKRKVIALLNEQKQAIIHSAVTRGLDLNVALKPSGIPWLGEIPVHWEVKRLGSLLRERGEGNDHGEISFVLSLLRGRGVIPYDEKGNIGNKKSEDITRYKIVRPDDIVMNCMNVIIGSVGISRYTGCLSPVYYVLVRRNESDSPSYLNAIFQCSSFHRSLVRIGNGILAHRMRIPMELLKCELLPYPPCAEQAQIIEGLRSATEAFDNAIDRTEREMDLLREYRTRLVSDVVTGKLDVREAAARLPDEEPLPDGAESDDESDAATDELLVDEETLL